MKKKIVSALMVAAMVVTAFAGCGSDKGGTSTQGGDKTSKSSGKVYMLNFKPETDEAWQNLAETYTDQTGVEVNVLTAADGQYNTTLQSEMAKSDAPTIFNVGNSSAAQTWNDYTYDLKDSELYKHLTDKSLVINYDDKVAAIATTSKALSIFFLFIECTSFFILTILLFLPFQTIRRIIVKNRVNYSSFCRTIIYPVFHLFLFHFTAASASGILPVCILLPE